MIYYTNFTKAFFTLKCYKNSRNMSKLNFFYPRKESAKFHAPIFTKLADADHHYTHIVCIEFQSSRNVETRYRN